MAKFLVLRERLDHVDNRADVVGCRLDDSEPLRRLHGSPRSQAEYQQVALDTVQFRHLRKLAPIPETEAAKKRKARTVVAEDEGENRADRQARRRGDRVSQQLGANPPAPAFGRGVHRGLDRRLVRRAAVERAQRQPAADYGVSFEQPEGAPSRIELSKPGLPRSDRDRCGIGGGSAGGGWG